jgi:hypothetical protein
LFVAGGYHLTELQEEQPIVDDFDELIEDLVGHNMLEFDIVIVDDIVIDVQGYLEPLVGQKVEFAHFVQ